MGAKALARSPVSGPAGPGSGRARCPWSRGHAGGGARAMYTSGLVTGQKPRTVGPQRPGEASRYRVSRCCARPAAGTGAGPVPGPASLDPRRSCQTLPRRSLASRAALLRLAAAAHRSAPSKGTIRGLTGPFEPANATMGLERRGCMIMQLFVYGCRGVEILLWDSLLCRACGPAFSHFDP